MFTGTTQTNGFGSLLRKSTVLGLVFVTSPLMACAPATPGDVAAAPPAPVVVVSKSFPPPLTVSCQHVPSLAPREVADPSGETLRSYWAARRRDDCGASS